MKKSCMSTLHVLWDNWKNALTASATILVIFSAIAYISGDIRQFIIDLIQKQMPIITLTLFVIPSIVYLVIVITKSLINYIRHKQVIWILSLSAVILLTIFWILAIYFDILPSEVNILGLLISKQGMQIALMVILLIATSFVLGLQSSNGQAMTKSAQQMISSESNCKISSADKLTSIFTNISPKNPLIWVLLIAIFIFLAMLALQHGLALSFSVLSILVATFFSARSLLMASNSLRLAQATSRPFLTLNINLFIGASPDRAILTLHVKNTGRLPADQTTISCSWKSVTNNSPTQYTLELEKRCPSLIFPDDTVDQTYLIIGRDTLDILYNQVSRLQIKANYHNKLATECHDLKRTFEIRVASVSPAINTPQPVPIPEEDYWD